MTLEGINKTLGRLLDTLRTRSLQITGTQSNCKRSGRLMFGIEEEKRLDYCLTNNRFVQCLFRDEIWEQMSHNCFPDTTDKSY